MKIEKIKNIYLSLAIFSVALLILFIILGANAESFLGLAYFTLALLAFLALVVFIILAVKTRRKQIICKKISKLLNVLDTFYERATELINLDDELTYDKLFLKYVVKDDNDCLLGNYVQMTLSKYELKSKELMNSWYESPLGIKLFIDSYKALINEMKPAFAPIPALLIEYYKERK